MPRLFFFFFLVTDFIYHVTELEAHMAEVTAWSALAFFLVKSGDRQRPSGAEDRC